MKDYTTPSMTVLFLQETDVIRTSSIFEDSAPGNGNDNDNVVGAPNGWL